MPIPRRLDAFSAHSKEVARSDYSYIAILRDLLRDEETWLIISFLAEDSRRRGRWSRALADLAVAQRPENRGVLAKWVGRWAARADEAALGLGTILEAEAGVRADDVVAHAGTARERFLAGLLETAAQNGTAQAGR